jgi:hypothetical protein
MPTGSRTGIAVLDLDKKNGKDGFAAIPDWQHLSPAIARTGSGGAHLYFRADGPVRCSTGKDGVDVRGDGGYVIVPPSTGYSWLTNHDFADLPPFPTAYRPRDHVAVRSDEAEADDPAMVAAALAVIPNDDVDYDNWVRIGMATYAATGGSEEGLDAWDKWSAKSGKYDGHATARRWDRFHRSPPTQIGAGTLFYEATEQDPDWWGHYHAHLDAEAQAAFANGAAEWQTQLGLGAPDKAHEEPGPSKGDDELLESQSSSPSTPEKASPPPAEQSEVPQLRKLVTALGEWDAGEDDWTIPPRKWLLGNVYCRSFVSSLVADGGIGKTALRLAQALSLTTGRAFTGENVFQRCRVLFVSLEDDRNELRRRVRAAMLHHGIEPEEIDGRLFLAAPEGKAGKLVTVDPRTKRPTISVMKAELEAVIKREQIDVLILDPLVKAHDVEENDNSAMDVVIQTLSTLAVEHDIAVDVLHHTSKGAADPGNADRGRGASAVKNGARLVYTLTQMSTDEAGRFGIDESDRRSFVRMDSGKVNITPPLASAKWFRIVGVSLGNPDPLYPNGDRVQTVEPWAPPQMWEGISNDMLQRILADIDAGVPADPERGISGGGRYSDAANAKTRAAWPVVARHVPGKQEKQCRQLIADLVKQKRLVARGYHDPNDRKERSGLFLGTQKDLDDEPM